MKQNAYYIIPDIEALSVEKDPVRLRMHRRRIAANIGDADTLRAILGDSSEDFHDFYGTSDLPQLSTEDTIDSFLEKFGKETPAVTPAVAAVSASGAVSSTEAGPKDDDALQVPVMPAVDYTSMLEEMAPADNLPPAGNDATLGAIDSFLSKTPPPRVRPKKEAKEEEKPSLTESFAKIMIKNGNYSRALEIITEISLNIPEKSVYFADQIRFLQKLILLESRKTVKN